MVIMCTFDGCDRPSVVKQLCYSHYRQQLRGKPLRPIGESKSAAAKRKADNKRLTYQNCLVQGCANTAAKDLCVKHRTIRSRLKMTTEQVVALLATNTCDACGVTLASSRDTHIDHNHSHHEQHGCIECVRGVLCATCNLALGLLHEDPARVKSLLRYLTEPRRFDTLFV